ncbi:hypothetical protein [Streptococcus sp. S784/96/1]|uniref:hypothetical protein n=1 Tax=Streptococcus sp. S784/96/1 TaxID=2653499 RepID=UPI001386F2C0|nr:hypothetical protein [Streptococcus sp. S784/96/1]
MESKGFRQLNHVVIDDFQMEEEVLALLQGYLRAERFSEGAIDVEGRIQALLMRLKYLTVI